MTSGDRLAFRYDNEIDLCHESTHTKVLGFVGQRQRVLELGCSTGQMTRVLKERGCQVVAIEADVETAKRAEEHCEQLIVGDLEQLDFDVELGDRRFDVIVAADVLEHLKEPEALLRRLRPFLTPGGYVVASVPNVTHGSVRLALLAGSFPYADTGLLDRTHLRFYNRESLTDMLSEGHFSPVHIETVDLEIERSEVPFSLGNHTKAFIEALRDQPDALTYQFVVLAFPTRPPLGPIPLLILDLNRRLAELRYRTVLQLGERDAEINGRQHELDELRSRTSQLEAEGAEKDHLVAAFQQHVDELRSRLEDRERALAEIHASRLWRLGGAYRAVAKLFRG